MQSSEKAAAETAPAAVADTRWRGAGAAAGGQAAEVICRADLRFDCLRSALYNAAREHWFDSLHRWMSFFVIVGGSGAAATVGREDSDVAFALALFAAISAGVSLAFDHAGRAREHGNLRRRFYELASELETEPDDPARLTRFQARLYALYGEERPHLHAVNAIAWNEAADSLYGPGEKPRLKVTRLQSALRHLLAFSTRRPSFA